MLYPWQHDSWQALAGLRERWPHALLIHGQAGIGKTAFARHIAQGLLCEAALPDQRPCGICVACKWFEQGNHPDFRAVYPESLAPAGEAGEGAEGADGQSAAAAGTKSSEPAKTKTPSKEIKIEQVRSLLLFSGIGAHRAGRRVVLLYPAEAMNAASSNALLKTLEEPPEGVVFVMVTSQIERLLPTIISRCRQWPMSVPSADVAAEWLRGQGLGEPAAALAEAGGAPLAALASAEQAGSAGVNAQQQMVLSQLGAGAACDAFACAEALQKTAAPLVLGWMQRWLYDLLSLRLGGPVRYFPTHASVLSQCAQNLDVAALAQMNQTLARQRLHEQHPLNARLVFESLFMRYRTLFSPAKH